MFALAVAPPGSIANMSQVAADGRTLGDDGSNRRRFAKTAAGPTSAAHPVS